MTTTNEAIAAASALHSGETVREILADSACYTDAPLVKLIRAYVEADHAMAVSLSNCNEHHARAVDDALAVLRDETEYLIEFMERQVPGHVREMLEWEE